MIRTFLSTILFASTLVFGLFSPQSGRAAIIVSELFPYSDGLLNGQGGATGGFSGPWTAASQFGIVSESVVFQPVAPISPVAASRPIAGGAPIPNDGESLYAALDLTISPLGDGSLAGFQVTLGAAGAGDSWEFGVSGAQFALGGGGSGGSVVPNTTYRIVTRLTRIDSGNDVISLWVNPATESDAPLLTASTPSFAAARSGLSQITMLGFEGFGFTFDAAIVDDINAGTSFDDVSGVPAAVPEPATLLSLGIAVTMLRLRRRR